jgi:hypothetical protein
MYGLVNGALQELLTERFGEQKWRSIAERAGVTDEVFMAHEGYDDAITYQLVASACEVTGVEAESLLIEFGEHWILNTARTRYPVLLRAAGLREFLLNLPNFHARVALTFDHLVPPTFSCSEVEDGALRVEYRSHREGLQPFVLGLLRGLSKHFETPASVEHVARRGEDSRDHDVFLMRMQPVAS